MTDVKTVMIDFYETLLASRYPGVAGITAQDIEDTILGSENRVFLLSWILTQSGVMEEFANKTDAERIVKWYTGMGICKNADDLLGKVPIEAQVSTLKNLILLMKNILIDQTNKNTEDTILPIDILKKHMDKTINVIPATCSLTSKVNYETQQYPKGRKKSLNEKSQSDLESPSKVQRSQSSAEMFHSITDKNAEIGTGNKTEDCLIQQFVHTFEESIPTWPSSINDDAMLELRPAMDALVRDIDTDFTILKETIRSQNEISKFMVNGNLQKVEMPLSGIIQDIVINFEGVSNLRKNA